MVLYTVRVELHDATWPNDYDKLHKEMHKQGFSNTVKADNGTIYHLPTAEYNAEGEYTIQQVQKAACDAANIVGKKYMVLVTKGVSRSWVGLDPLKQAS